MLEESAAGTIGLRKEMSKIRKMARKKEVLVYSRWTRVLGSTRVYLLTPCLVVLKGNQKEHPHFGGPKKRHPKDPGSRCSTPKGVPERFADLQVENPMGSRSLQF